MAFVTKEGFLFNKGEWTDVRERMDLLPDGVTIEHFLNSSDLVMNTAAGSTGMEFPNVDIYYVNPLITVDMVRHASKHYIVSRIMRQIDDFAFSGAYIKVSPPEAEAEDITEQEIDDCQQKVDEIDKKVVKTITRCRQTVYDELIYGTAVFEKVKGLIEGWKAPVIVKRLPAYSFCERPAARMDIMKYVVGDVLYGIVFDKEADVFEFWQKQNQVSVPVMIPTKNVIHVRDEVSEQVDGTSFLVQILPLVKKLEFADMCLMQTVHRAGAPILWITVEEYPDKKGALQAVPSAWTPKQAYDNGKNLGKNWGKDSVLIANSSLTPHPLDFKMAIDPIRVVEFLERRILYALIPRDFTEQSGQAVSKTSAPTLKLLVLVAEGWRTRAAKPWIELWQEILADNGYKGWKVEIVWKELDPTDEKSLYDRVSVANSMSVFTEDEIRDMVGYEPKPEDPDDPNLPENQPQIPMIDPVTGEPVIGADGQPVMQPNAPPEPKPGAGIVNRGIFKKGKSRFFKKKKKNNVPAVAPAQAGKQIKTSKGDEVVDTKGKPIKNTAIVVNTETKKTPVELEKIMADKARLFAKWAEEQGYLPWEPAPEPEPTPKNLDQPIKNDAGSWEKYDAEHKGVPKEYYAAGLEPVLTSPANVNDLIPDVSGRYKEAVFDCTEMAAYGQWYLANHGIESQILASPKSQSHAWLAAKTTSGTVMIDMTAPKKERVQTNKKSFYYSPEFTFNTVYQAVIQVDKDGDHPGIEPWDWWLAAPDLKK